MKPKDLEEAEEWLRRVRNDLRPATHDLSAEPPLLEDVMFHCQQAIEKALKAYLAGHGQPFPKTHDLSFLYEACKEIDPNAVKDLEGLQKLTVYAWAYRYPGNVDPPERSECEEAIALASKVKVRIESLLSE